MASSRVSPIGRERERRWLDPLCSPQTTAVACLRAIGGFRGCVELYVPVLITSVHREYDFTLFLRLLVGGVIFAVLGFFVPSGFACSSGKDYARSVGARGGTLLVIMQFQVATLHLTMPPPVHGCMQERAACLRTHDQARTMSTAAVWFVGCLMPGTVGQDTHGRLQRTHVCRYMGRSLRRASGGGGEQKRVLECWDTSPT